MKHDLDELKHNVLAKPTLQDVQLLSELVTDRTELNDVLAKVITRTCDLEIISEVAEIGDDRGLDMVFEIDGVITKVLAVLIFDEGYEKIKDLELRLVSRRQKETEASSKTTFDAFLEKAKSCVEILSQKLAANPTKKDVMMLSAIAGPEVYEQVILEVYEKTEDLEILDEMFDHAEQKNLSVCDLLSEKTNELSGYIDSVGAGELETLTTELLATPPTREQVYLLARSVEYPDFVKIMADAIRHHKKSDVLSLAELATLDVYRKHNFLKDFIDVEDGS